MVSEYLRREHNKGKRTSLIVLLLAIGLALGVLGVIIVRKYSSGDELPTQPEAQESEAPRRVSGPAQNEPKTPKENQPEVDENELFAPRETEPAFARLELPDFWGSKFQARLTLGEFAAQLAAWTNDQAFTPEQIEDALARSFGYALSVDNMGAFREAARAGDKDALIDAILEELTKVRREGLTLQTPRGAKPILEADGKAWGRDALVRIWSKSKGLDSFVVNDAERMVRDILRLCQASAGEGNMGYDLLYGEQLGGEFFPDSAFIDVEARGVYVLQDKLSMVAHQRSVIQVDTVVKHELVHAVLYGLSDDFESSRFISEGLAEYLRLLPQLEPEKGVSERALAHEAAALLSMLSIMKAKGADLSQLSFDRMLALKPSGFYGLGTFGYLSAQLAMAFSGWETVSTSLRANNDRAIANLLKTRGWDEFEAFLKRVAKGGNPRKARSVSDRVIGPPYLKDSEFVLALNQAGIIPTKGTSRALLELSRDSISSGRSAASALLGNASATMLYLSDTSKALEASFVYAQVPPSETFPIPNTSLAVNTRQLFVENLHYELQNQRNAVIPFVALHENLFDLPRLGDFTPPISPREGAMTFYGVPDRVRYWQNLNEASGYSLVIATASRDEHTRERIATAYRNEIEALTGPERETYIDQILSLFYMESLTSAGLDVGSVLIIDLAQGASDAAILASAISQVLTQKGLSDSVVLWDPQSEAGN